MVHTSDANAASGRKARTMQIAGTTTKKNAMLKQFSEIVRRLHIARLVLKRAPQTRWFIGASIHRHRHFFFAAEGTDSQDPLFAFY